MVSSRSIAVMVISPVVQDGFVESLLQPLPLLNACSAGMRYAWSRLVLHEGLSRTPILSAQN